jgi:hypothetical protein
VVVAFFAGLSPVLWALVGLALLLTSGAYWLSEIRIDKSEQQRKPRSLSSDEKEEWTSSMKAFGGINVRLYGFGGDVESQAFGGMIIMVLRDAGLIVELTNFLVANGVVPDIAVFIDKSHESDRIGDAGTAFVGLLMKKKLACYATSVPDEKLTWPKQVEQGMLHIHIGPRYFYL